MDKDEQVCFEETTATPQEREAACARIGIFGVGETTATLAGHATPARRVPVPKRGCRVATWGGRAWRVNRNAERVGAEVALAPGQVLVCGTTRLKHLAKLLPKPQPLAVDLGRGALPALAPLPGLGGDLEKVTIDVVIGRDGITRFKINGVKGPACTGIARAIKAATGLDVISDSPTAEYYEEPVSISTTVKTKYSL